MSQRYSNVKASQKLNLVYTVLPGKIAQLQTLQQDWERMKSAGDVGTWLRKWRTPRDAGPFQRLILEFQDLINLSGIWQANHRLTAAMHASPYYWPDARQTREAPNGANTWLDRLMVQRIQLITQWHVVENHPQTQRHVSQTRVTEDLDQGLLLELVNLGKEYAALFALTHYGPCVAIPDTSRLGADPTRKWDARGGPFQVTSSARIPARLEDPGSLHLALHEEADYMLALDACGTRLSETVPEVINEFSGRVQAAIREIQAEMQEVLVSIAVDKGPPLPAAKSAANAVCRTTSLTDMRASLQRR